MTDPAITMATLVVRRADDDSVAILFEDRSWTYRELVSASAERAGLAAELRRPGPFHIGVLLDNVPEYPMWLSAAALSGATVVGINPTRQGAELARDITHTDCQLILTEPQYRPMLDGLDLGLDADRILDVDSEHYAGMVAAHRDRSVADVGIDPEDRYLLLFTSGTSGAPKACIASHGRTARIGEALADRLFLDGDDVCYLVMPMFHSNAIFAGWAPAVAGGATSALRRRFSASGFLPDVRRFGATYFNYVGKPLSYILATPKRPDDADNSLTRVFGNEAADLDIARFARRFGCPVVDAYGSTEGGVSIGRTPDMPEGALGVAPDGTVVADPETGEECPRAVFDEVGRLRNPDEAVGEIVNTAGASSFEGYYKNEEADAERTRQGWYWSGDLGYRDADGYFYFAGRSSDWLRVDGENFSAAPVERILARHSDVVLASLYAVPDPIVGDQAMAALQLRPDTAFDAVDFARFLAAQGDLGTKSAPRFVRIAEALPVTETNKVLKGRLRREHWECEDPVWWRPDRDGPYQQLTADDVDRLRKEFDARGREAALEAL